MAKARNIDPLVKVKKTVSVDKGPKTRPFEEEALSDAPAFPNTVVDINLPAKSRRQSLSRLIASKKSSGKRARGMTLLKPKRLKLTEILEFKLPEFKFTPTIPEGQIKEATEKNKAQGIEHAEGMRRTTPVLSPELRSPNKDMIRKFVVRKVILPNGKIDLALTIDGEPWQYQPEEIDVKPGTLSDVLTSHDILCHAISARDRTHFLTNPIGERCTGHVGGDKTILPSEPHQYDGIVFNIADSRIRNETGETIYSSLQGIFKEFRTNSQIPIGSQVELEFCLPPADLVWEEVPGDGKKAYYGVGSPVFPIKPLLTSKIPKIEGKLLKDQTVTKETSQTTVTRTRYTCSRDLEDKSLTEVVDISFDKPPELGMELLGGSEENVRYAKKYVLSKNNDEVLSTQDLNLEEASNLLEELLHDPNVKTEKCVTQEPITVSTYKRKTTNPDLEEVYEISRDSSDRITSGHKYFNSKSLGKILWQEGKLILDGASASKGKLVAYESRDYMVKKPNSKRIKGSSFVVLDGNNFGSEAHIVPASNQYRPVYTGHPYRHVSVKSFDIQSPEGHQIPQEARGRIIGSLAEFALKFTKFEEHKEDILSRGVLPLDEPLDAGTSSSYLDRIRHQVTFSSLPVDTELSIGSIQRAIYDNEKRNLETSTPAVKPFIEDGEFYIAPFPPPPFKEK